MGIFDWLGGPKERASVSAPSADHPTPISAIQALLEIDAAAGDDGLWITFNASGGSAAPGGAAVIEVSGHNLNFCTEEVDLPAVLRDLGCTELAAMVTAGGRKQTDTTMWTLPHAVPEELAAAVDAVFLKWLGEGYRVEGERHD